MFHSPVERKRGQQVVCNGLVTLASVETKVMRVKPIKGVDPFRALATQAEEEGHEATSGSECACWSFLAN